jgi:hypothetical protein
MGLTEPILQFIIQDVVVRCGLVVAVGVPVGSEEEKGTQQRELAALLRHSHALPCFFRCLLVR